MRHSETIVNFSRLFDKKRILFSSNNPVNKVIMSLDYIILTKCERANGAEGS